MSYLLTVTCIVLSWGPLWNVELPTYKCFENSPAHFILVPSFRSLQFTISRPLLSDFNPAKVVLNFLLGEAKKKCWTFFIERSVRVCVCVGVCVSMRTRVHQGASKWVRVHSTCSCIIQWNAGLWKLNGTRLPSILYPSEREHARGCVGVRVSVCACAGDRNKIDWRK